MEFLKNHFEKLILGIALLVLMSTAVLLAMKMGEGHLDQKLNFGPSHGPPPIIQTYLDELGEQAKHPPQWKATQEPPLFTSVIRWWEKDPKQGWILVTGKGPTPIGEPCKDIPAKWFAQYELDYKDPGICDKDSDGDGWTNAEEYRFKTNPKDPNSHPMPPDYLYFDGTVQNKFYLLFRGYTRTGDDVNDPKSYTFQINVNDFDHTYFVRVGEQIRDSQRTENYWVDDFKYASKEEFDPNLGSKITKEVSRLTIHRDKEDRKIVLPFRETSLDTQLKVKIENRLDPDKPIVKAVGETFDVRGQTYKVVDIKNDAVIISDSLNQEFNIAAPKTGE